MLGHCRTPWYVRGKSGVVIAVQGRFRDPERLAYHRPGLPAQALYKVRFQQREVWPTYRGANGDHIEVDIYEHWLEPDQIGAHMHEHDNDHDHDHDASTMTTPCASSAQKDHDAGPMGVYEVLEEALRSLLIEKGILTAEDHRRRR